MTEMLANLLRHDIEALADEVETADRGQTRRMTRFTVIKNGLQTAEGAHSPPVREPVQMCHDSLVTAQELRSRIVGPAVLTWRIPPQFEERGQLYMRLAFEPTEGPRLGAVA